MVEVLIVTANKDGYTYNSYSELMSESDFNQVRKYNSSVYSVTLKSVAKRRDELHLIKLKARKLRAENNTEKSIDFLKLHAYTDHDKQGKGLVYIKEEFLMKLGELDNFWIDDYLRLVCDACDAF